MTLRHLELANVLYAALRDDPFYRTLENTYPDRNSARDAMLRYYDLSIREGETWGRIGKLGRGAWGISVWSLPLSASDSSSKAESKRRALLEAMGPECTACFERIEANMARHENALGLQDHWYLSILGVAPELQGQGLGGQLLRPVIDDADAAGAASYLTTFTPRNIPFYAKHGYRLAGTFPESETGVDFHVLIRPPGGT